MKKIFFIIMLLNSVSANLFCQGSLNMLQQAQQDINSQLKSNKNKIASVIKKDDSFQSFAKTVFGGRRYNNCPTSKKLYVIYLVSKSKVMETAYYCEDEHNQRDKDYQQLINYLNGGGDANNGYRKGQIVNPNFRRTKSNNPSVYVQGANYGGTATSVNTQDPYSLSQLGETGQIKGSPFDAENPRTKYSITSQSTDNGSSDDGVTLQIGNDFDKYLRNKANVASSEGGVVLDDTHGPLSVKYQNNGVVLPETKLSISESTTSLSNENMKTKERSEGREEWLKKLDSMSPAALAVQEKNYKQLSDMAGLAEYSYKEKQGLPLGWDTIKNSNLSALISKANTNNDGFHCELLYNDSTKKYVLSFRGTELTDVKDLADDLVGNYIKSTQTKDAINITNNITKALLNSGIDSKDLQLTGHSLGGRLAAESSMATGLVAYTFNAADVSWTTRNDAGINNKGNILNTVSSTDLLTNSPVGLGSNGGGINHQSTKKIISDYSSFPIINQPTLNDYMSGYTNVINEAAGYHSMSPLREAIVQRHNDIVNKIKSNNSK